MYYVHVKDIIIDKNVGIRQNIIKIIGFGRKRC